jgi:hypothetical protein
MAENGDEWEDVVKFGSVIGNRYGRWPVNTETALK